MSRRLEAPGGKTLVAHVSGTLAELAMVGDRLDHRQASEARAWLDQA
ncbi:MAG: hypothetical protein IT180_12000 [Acidobacteria bacterium]|nr:hypothetical protein [Acidobacteriota bacterium]